MLTRLAPLLAALALAGAATRTDAHRAPGPTLTPMPAELETRWALSAAPPRLREGATVHLLDPSAGYRVARQGTSGVACLVQRTAWELGDFRDDVYIPLCYDAEGARTYLRVIMDAAALRARGTGAAALKVEMERRWRDGTYRVPARGGVSYMLAPVFRTVGPPDLQVRTMAMPHLMFYAPGVTNADLGARPDLADPASLEHPFIDRQGNAEQSYIIQLAGAAERARILADERALVAALCAHRAALCLATDAR